VERIEQALAQAIRIAKRTTKVAKREQERVRELYLRKRREKVRGKSRERSREPHHKYQSKLLLPRVRVEHAVNPIFDGVGKGAARVRASVNKHRQKIAAFINRYASRERSSARRAGGTPGRATPSTHLVSELPAG
jgi:hypothetical protein